MIFKINKIQHCISLVIGKSLLYIKIDSDSSVISEDDIFQYLCKRTQSIVLTDFMDFELYESHNSKKLVNCYATIALPDNHDNLIKLLSFFKPEEYFTLYDREAISLIFQILLDYDPEVAKTNNDKVSYTHAEVLALCEETRKTTISQCTDVCMEHAANQLAHGETALAEQSRQDAAAVTFLVVRNSVSHPIKRCISTLSFMNSCT